MEVHCMHELASIYIHVGMEPHTDRQTRTHAGTCTRTHTLSHYDNQY